MQPKWKFERTNFERKLHLGMNLKERQFSTETNFERTTDEFWKNVIRSNDLARYYLTFSIFKRDFRFGLRLFKFGVISVLVLDYLNLAFSLHNYELIVLGILSLN